MPEPLARRILRSLLKDLLVPWLISAVLIVLIALMIAAFGFIAWPVAFLVFIFICVEHDKARKRAAAATAGETAVPSDRAPPRDNS